MVWMIFFSGLTNLDLNKALSEYPRTPGIKHQNSIVSSYKRKSDNEMKNGIRGNCEEMEHFIHMSVVCLNLCVLAEVLEEDHARLWVQMVKD